MNIKPALTKIALAMSALLLSLGAYAVPTVSQDGLDVTITTSSSGQTVSFTFLAQFGDAATAGSWIGTTMDALSIQFGCIGNSCDDEISSFSNSASTSANVSGTWKGELAKVSGNGCNDGNTKAICYTVLSTGTVDSASETTIQANTAYSWMFDVIFKPTVDIASVLSGGHSIKFLSLEQNSKGKWKTGNQLSQSGSFGPPPPPRDVPVPEPGSLALLGTGLIAIGFRFRKKR